MKVKNFGKIKLKIGENTIYEIDILAKNNIRKKNIADYLTQLLNELGENLTFMDIAE